MKIGTNDVRKIQISKGSLEGNWSQEFKGLIMKSFTVELDRFRVAMVWGNCWKFLHFIFLRFYLFLERGAGKEKGRETSMCGCLLRPPPLRPPGVLGCNPGLCPDWESNWQPLGAQSTEPHQPGQIVAFLKVTNKDHRELRIQWKRCKSILRKLLDDLQEVSNHNKQKKEKEQRYQKINLFLLWSEAVYFLLSSAWLDGLGEWSSSKDVGFWRIPKNRRFKDSWGSGGPAVWRRYLWLSWENESTISVWSFTAMVVA